MTTTTGTWYPPAFINPPFKMTPLETQLLRQRLQGITDQATIMRIIADQILDRHHRASACEIAHLLLDAAGVEVQA